jgi:hypothetical protein
LDIFTGPFSENCCCITWNGNSIFCKTRGHGWCKLKVFIWQCSSSIKWMFLLNMLYLVLMLPCTILCRACCKIFKLDIKLCSFC